MWNWIFLNYEILEIIYSLFPKLKLKLWKYGKKKLKITKWGEGENKKEIER